jgi:hypothetical protein
MPVLETKEICLRLQGAFSNFLGEAEKIVKQNPFENNPLIGDIKEIEGFLKHGTANVDDIEAIVLSVIGCIENSRTSPQGYARDQNWFDSSHDSETRALNDEKSMQDAIESLDKEIKSIKKELEKQHSESEGVQYGYGHGLTRKPREMLFSSFGDSALGLIGKLIDSEKERFEAKAGHKYSKDDNSAFQKRIKAYEDLRTGVVDFFKENKKNFDSLQRLSEKTEWSFLGMMTASVKEFTKKINTDFKKILSTPIDGPIRAKLKEVLQAIKGWLVSLLKFIKSKMPTIERYKTVKNAINAVRFEKGRTKDTDTASVTWSEDKKVLKYPKLEAVWSRLKKGAGTVLGPIGKAGNYAGEKASKLNDRMRKTEGSKLIPSITAELLKAIGEIDKLSQKMDSTVPLEKSSVLVSKQLSGRKSLPGTSNKSSSWKLWNKSKLKKD